jgi:hypothetical protein
MAAVVKAVGKVVTGVVDLVVDTVGNVVDLVVDTVGNVVDVVVDVVDWVIDDIINPVVEGVGDTIQYVLDNPIEAIAKIAAVASGQVWAIALVDAAIVLDNGGDIGDAVKAAAISYAGASIGATTGQYASAAVAKAGGSAIMATIVGAGTKSATTALVYGQDPIKAFKTGGIQAAMGAALGKIDDLMEGKFEDLQDGAKDTIFAQLAAKLEGGNITSDQMTSIVSEYAGVGDFMTNFLKNNAGFSKAQAAIVTSAVMSSVSTALAGNPELSGEAFFAEFSKAGAADLKALIDKPVNNAIDKISGAYSAAEAKANLLNDATNNAATAAEKYNDVQATLGARIKEQDRLKAAYNQELTNYNKNQSSAAADRVNAASKAYNDYATKLETDYNKTLKPQLDAHQADFNKWNTQIPALEKSYTDAMAWVVTKAEDLDTELKPVMSAADKAVALTLRPEFDEDAYRKINGLSATADVYSHYLSQGQNLPTSKTAIDAVLGDAQYNSAIQALAAKGVDFWSLEQSQMDAVLAYSSKNLTSISTITGTDFSTFADKLIAVAKNTSTTDVKEYKKATNVKPADIATGDAKLTNVNGELQWMLASEIASAFGGQVVGTKLAPAGSNPNVLRIEITQGNLQTNTVYTVPDWEVPGKSLSSMVTDAREDNSFSASLTKTIVGLGDEAGRLLDTYVNEPIYDSVAKLYNYYLKDTAAGAALQNTASVVAGAAGETLQAVSGFAVIAGANPNNGLGRLAKNLLALSGDVQSDAWTAGAKDMQTRSQDYDVQWRKDNPGKEPSKWQKAQLKAEAIWGNVKNHPVQFIAENIVGELLQEVPLLLISGGVGNIAKTALLKGGAAYSATIAAKVAGTKVTTALGLDMAEAFGGTAASAFDETYATAIKMGKSAEEATKIAVDTAQTAGITALVLVGVTAGFGGQALAKSLFGDNVSDYTVSGLNILAKKVTDGAKVTIKEGSTEFVEEALPQLIVATVNSQMDPSYDVAGSVWENGFMGAISGTGVAATLYSGNAVADAAVRLNSSVQTALSTAKNPTEAAAALKKLGITDQLVVNNVLDSKYDSSYTSSAEADAVFAKSNPSYIPTQEELDSFVGANKDADIQKLVDSHIDTRFIDIAEVKKAAAEEGITLTDEQAASYAGQKNESAAIKTIKAKYDPLGTTQEEARQFFNDLGFTPTDAQVAQFVASKTEKEQKAAIATFVDPLQTTEAEAREMLGAAGYTPTDAEVRKFVGQLKESKQKTAIDTYVNPRQTTEAEARKFFTAQGYEPTDAEVAARVGQGGATFETDTKAGVDTYVNPRQTTEAEVRQAFADLGYEPTDAEVADRVGQGGDTFETDTKAGVEPYVNPRQTTEAEARKFFTDQGYEPTDAEVAARVGQGGDTFETDTKADVKPYVNPRQTTEAEARKFFTDQGYEPTDAEVADRVGQGGDTFETDTKAGVDTYVDPRYVDESEVTAAYEVLGLKRPTDADIQALIGQYMETDLAGKAEEYLPTARYNSIMNILENLSGETGISDEVKDALDVVKNDMINAMDDLGLEVAAIDKAVTEVKDAVGAVAAGDAEASGLYAYIDTAVQDLKDAGLTDEEVRTTINELVGTPATETTEATGLYKDFSGLSDLLGDPATADTEGTGIYGYIDGAVDALGQDLSNLDTRISDVETNLLDRVDTYEAAGIERSEALSLALDDLSADLGTTRTDLLTEMEQTEAGLLAEIEAAKTGLDTRISDVETNLLDRVDTYEAAGIERSEALSLALDDLSADLGTTRTDLLTEMEQTEAGLLAEIEAAKTGLDTRISDVETNLLDRVDTYEAAGIERSEALSLALDDLSADLGTTRTDLLTEMEQTEAGLLAEIEAAKTGLDTRISDVETNLLDRVDTYEAAGIERSEALSLALDDLSADLGTTRTDLLTEMEQTEAGLLAEIEAAKTGLDTRISDVETNLLDRVDTYEAAGIERSEALSLALDDLSADLGTTRTDLLTEMEQTEAGLLAEIEAAKTGLDTRISDVETNLLDRVDTYEAAGIERSEALSLALDDLSADLGTTRTDLLTEMEQTEAGLLAEIEAAKTGLDTRISDVETNLLDRVDTYEAAGIERSEALSLALDDLSADLGTTKTDLLASIGETETSLLGAIGETEGRLTTEIEDSKTELLTLIGENEAAGMTRDEATQAAIGELAAAFNVGRTELLTAIGETEASLAGQLGDVAASLGADIQTVADLIGKPAREVTQTDIDFVIDLIAQENVSAELMMQYDVTGDGIVDINDQIMLETALQGGDVTLADTSMFTPATGLYLQQEQDTQALLDEQARIAEELRIQQELDTQTVLDQNTELNTQLNTQINTNAQQKSLRDFLDAKQSGAFDGGGYTATTPDPVGEITPYDWQTIFRDQEQADRYVNPYGPTRATPANLSTRPLPPAAGFAAGGQVEDINAMLLKLLGDT